MGLEDGIVPYTRIKPGWGVAERAQWLRSLVALAGDPVVIPSTRIVAHNHP